MTLSNLTSRGTIKGTIYRGGGGGVTDYNFLSGKPQINGVTVEDNHDGGYYGLIDSADIEVTEIYEIGYGTTYDINLNGSTVNVTNQRFHGATSSTNGSKGLVPAPAAGSVGKILSNEGWIDPPSSIVNYSTTEQKTGQKWIDGSDIYIRVFDLGSEITYNPGWHVLSIPHENINRIFDGLFISDSGVSCNVGLACNDATYIEILVYSGTSSVQGRYLVARYTKSS